jgi:hypothetical protein
MKHFHTQLLMLTVLLSTSALADDAAEVGAPPLSVPSSRQTVVGISVVPLIGNGVLELEGERVVGPRLSVGMRLRAGLARTESEQDIRNDLGMAQSSGNSEYLLGAEPMARIFLTGTAPEGLWLSPRLGVAYQQWGIETQLSPVDASTEARSWRFTGAALLGYSTIVGKGLAVQFGAGLEAGYSRSSSTSRMPVLGAEGQVAESESRQRSWSVSERVDVSVGWAF